MSRMNSKTNSGFTIVELIIVIVVIAVLAAISIASYSTVRAKAEKSKTVAIAKDYITALAAYKAGEGGYPTTSTYCLGDGYIDRTGDGKPDCRWNSGNVNPNDSFNTTLAKYVRVTAKITQRPVAWGSANVIGMYFMNDSLGKLDGNPQLNWLVYVVPDKNCGMNVPKLSNTYPEFNNKSDDTVSEDWGSGGLCWIPLK